MKRTLLALCIAALAAPAFAQIADGDVDALMKRWVTGYNKGDVAGLSKDVYAAPDEARLTAMFTELRADSFGKLDVYSSAACMKDAEHGRAILKFARIYTFGGKMNDDEAKVFDLVKTAAGWRVSAEKDVDFGTALSCS